MSFFDKIKQTIYFHKLIGTLMINGIYTRIYGKESDYWMTTLYNDVVLNGCVITKLAQWGITRYNVLYNKDNKPEWLKLFDNIYENCEEHSFETTKKIFKDEFGEEYEDIFEGWETEECETKPIASGSIGQVYRAMLENGEKVAVKVIHPHMEIKSAVPIYFLKLYNNILKSISYFCSISIPFDLNTFFEDIEKQIDFRYEYDNIVRYNNMYKDNDLIIIPKPYMRGKNILVTSYEEGTFFEDIDISDYTKNKIVQLLVLFIRDTSIIHQYMHSDLHQGNWKVRKVGNEYALVIYDLGICFEFEKDIIQDFWYYWEKGDKLELSKLFARSVASKPDNISSEEIQNDIYSNLLEYSYKPLDASTTIGETISYLNKKNIIMNSYWMTLCIIISLVEEFFIKYDVVNRKGLDADKTGADVFKVFYLNYISFCETHNVFPELKLHLEKSLERADIKFNTLFTNIEYKLNNGEEKENNFNEIKIDDNNTSSNITLSI